MRHPRINCPSADGLQARAPSLRPLPRRPAALPPGVIRQAGPKFWAAGRAGEGEQKGVWAARPRAPDQMHRDRLRPGLRSSAPSGASATYIMNH